MSNGASSDPEKFIALDEELHTSIRLIQEGFRVLQQISGGNDFYHLPMLLLAGGLERLMKIILCLKVLCETGEYPADSGHIRDDLRHDLTRILSEVLNECFSDTYRQRTAAQHDFCYLTTDPILRRIIDILSRFGQKGRYYNMDIIWGDIKDIPSPKDAWEELEKDLIRQDADWEEKWADILAIRDNYQKLDAELIARLERLVRALARLFTIGDIRQEGERFCATIGTFLYLRDDQLGKTIY